MQQTDQTSNLTIFCNRLNILLEKVQRQNQFNVVIGDPKENEWDLGAWVEWVGISNFSTKRGMEFLYPLAINDYFMALFKFKLRGWIADAVLNEEMIHWTVNVLHAHGTEGLANLVAWTYPGPDVQDFKQAMARHPQFLRRISNDPTKI